MNKTPVSFVLLETLLPALAWGAKSVVVELVPGTTVISRVTPFAIGKGPEIPFDVKYTVSRIATQRQPDGAGEHLKVFLKQPGSPAEKAYNVDDSFLQHILIAALAVPSPPVTALVDVTFDGDEIATVKLGQRDLIR